MNFPGGNLHIENSDRPLLKAFRATVSYDGTEFAGSQVQINSRTVAGEINSALSKICGHGVRATMASRTDAGVHAYGQVIGWKTSSNRNADELYRGLNSILTKEIRVKGVEECGFDFHPRYSAVGKYYCYRIYRGREIDPMRRNQVLFIESHKPWELETLRTLAKELEGERDFRSFSPRLLKGENPVKVIHRIAVIESGEETEIRICGSGFLYQMVRRIVGVLIAIVQGRASRELLTDAIESPEVGKVTFNAKPSGLYLMQVFYSQDEMRREIEGWSV